MSLTRSLIGVLLLTGLILEPLANNQQHRNIKVSDSDTLVYKVLPDLSVLKWFSEPHNGKIEIKEGVFYFKGKQIVDGMIKIDMNSLVNLDIDYELMKGVLENVIKSDAFFDVVNFPEAVFRIYSVKQVDRNTYIVAGDLRIREAEKCINFNTQMRVLGDTLTVVTESLKINRTNWGITAMSKDYVNSEDGYVVQDTINFSFVVKAIRVK